MTTDTINRKGLIEHFTHALTDAKATQGSLVTKIECERYARALDHFADILGSNTGLEDLAFTFGDKPEAFIRGTAIVNGHRLNLVINNVKNEISLNIMSREDQDKTKVSVAMHFHDDGIDKIRIKKRWFDESWDVESASATAGNNRRNRTSTNTAHGTFRETNFCSSFEGTDAIDFLEPLQKAVLESLV
ncbi:hypothetical protein CO112_01325 [Candidatus Dojkabacteria bacterium CG_4_9_14_3_um_filter_150_Dojkabacteria_WS6_41_13]|uniref:Uncharacterized protein n=1 Tax=Candidatus Dojkabacteria bacterium CG_4_10_14_0_2_um_filter_Dojkabacteria_WS6_41_15 TaxID=2014249 RepID=A0A2M7W273_9BACT|nr:MAG: hypothetical protein COX64_02075 [Candidatus Dojkabacteria bacterium CG_4_10_14_0_2_um_filter_Dojkabacteria_WS6_41_15]PJB23226.1 MAG: hypothetical protein CO112_01325 [Candidatus Dojkabacteria bacterium CG_4_9_14_3_um_filter_150_Dojkabacteria_WS6_41_13]